MRGVSQPSHEVRANKLTQSTFVQSGAPLTRQSSTLSGSSVGTLLAPGINPWKEDKASLDKASAAPFRMPGMWLHTSDTSHLARKKDRHLIRCITFSTLLLPELTMATTVALSHLHDTVKPLHLLPHAAAPITIGSNSFTVMCVSLQLSGSCSWNHQPSDV